MITHRLTLLSLRAGLWLTVYRFFSKGIGVVKTAILARLLTPTQFGVFGVVSIGLNLLETFSDAGIETALIQQDKIARTDLTTAWLLGIARGLIVGLILFLSAPLIAAYFTTPGIEPFIWAIATTPPLRALRNPSAAQLKKDLNFKPESFMLMSGSLIEVITAISVTLLTYSVWGLVASIVAGALAELAASYLFMPLPKLSKPSLVSAKKLLSYGRWLWSTSALAYLINQGDDIVVGKILGTSALGFYQNAYKIASLPATQITDTISRVTFPAFANIYTDKIRLRRALKKTLWLTALTTIPATLALVLLARPLTLIIFGPAWLPLVPALRVLGTYGAIRAVITILGSLAKAVGKPKMVATNGLLRFIILFALIVPLSQTFGIVGASWATVISITIGSLVFIWQIRHEL